MSVRAEQISLKVSVRAEQISLKDIWKVSEIRERGKLGGGGGGDWGVWVLDERGEGRV